MRTALIPTSRALSTCDRRAGSAVFWAFDAERLTWSERANPLRVIFHWALTAPGSRLGHAGAVGTEGGGILVAGPSGAGKSTVTMACLSAGFDFAGDDHVLLTFREDGVVAHALYGTAKLHRDAPGASPRWRRSWSTTPRSMRLPRTVRCTPTRSWWPTSAAGGQAPARRSRARGGDSPHRGAP